MSDATGNGLNILISCEMVPHHDWMTFASWYSIHKNLPDAQVSISCLRKPISKKIFNWPVKCHVPFSQYSGEIKIPENTLVLTPDIMAVSYYDLDTMGPITAKSDENCTFVSYREGCGKFVCDEWINTLKNPFGISNLLYSEDLRLNEYRILKMWGKCYKTYNAIA